MGDFVWILPAGKGASFGASGVSSSYILPKGGIQAKPEALAGKRIWVLLRDAEDRIFLSAQTKLIERVIEGYYQDDYILRINLQSSFRLVSNYTEAAIYTSSQTQNLPLGLHAIDDTISNDFIRLVTQSLTVRLTAPDKKLLPGMDLDILPRSSGLLARTAVREIVSHLNLNQIWGSGTEQRLGAFANFAHALIAEEASINSPENITLQLKSLDPIATLSQNNSKGDIERKNKNKLPPKVDMDFTIIEPGKIYAREFLPTGNKIKGLEAALNKTEHAEKAHQEMLKDISEFLISKGIVPYESGSIDLMYQSSTGLRVCEIKSTTVDNILAQSAKGSFQLACYTHELANDYDYISLSLILQVTGQIELEDYLMQVLKRSNISVLFYNAGKRWPDRVNGLI